MIADGRRACGKIDIVEFDFEKDEDILPEYDFARGVRAKHHEAYNAGTRESVGMNAQLTPKLEHLINERLQSGAYKSATEVIEDAFEALSERENFQAIRAELDHADEQLERGDYAEYDENAIHELAERIKTRGRARLAEERDSSVR